MPADTIIEPHEIVRLRWDECPIARAQFGRLLAGPHHHVICRAVRPAPVLMPLEIIRMRHDALWHTNTDALTSTTWRDARANLHFEILRDTWPTWDVAAQDAHLVLVSHGGDHSSNCTLKTPLNADDTTTDIHASPFPVPACVRMNLV